MLITAVAILIGIVIAIPGTIVPSSRFLRPRHEKVLYALLLIPIALFYIGFAYYYGNLDALHAELVGLIIFVVLALIGLLLSNYVIAFAYLAHGLWDLAHEIWLGGFGNTVPWTQVPMGYAAFCLTFDVIIAYYIYRRARAWHKDERLLSH